MATHYGLGLGEPVAGDNAGVGRSSLVVGRDYWIGVRLGLGLKGLAAAMNDVWVWGGEREERVSGLGFTIWFPWVLRSGLQNHFWVLRWVVRFSVGG